MEQNLEFKAGTLICFATGEYSDYSYRGHFLCLVNVSHNDIRKIGEEVKECAPEYDYEIHERFIARCIKEGWLLSIDCREIHIGSYSELELE